MARHSYPCSDLSGLSFDRFLIIKPSSLGDIVHALPVLHGLRTRYPDARIDWLVGSAFAPVLEGHTELNELILFDRRRFGRVGRSARITREFMRFVQSLRARRYDVVIDLQGLFRTGFLSRASGAAVRVGFRTAREGAWIFYNHRITVEEPDAHAVDRNYLVAGLLGFEDIPIEFNLGLSEHLRDKASALLHTAGSDDQARLVAVVPGARWETKVWSPERFAETIDALHAEGDARCLLLGGPDEARLCERIAGQCRSEPINLAGRTDARDFAAVIGLADVVLCHDSAAMHLAVAMDRPLVCLIGPTNPSRTGPYGRSEDVVRLDLSCAPCYIRKVARCPHDHRCMSDLGTARVVTAVRAAIGQRSTHPV